MKLNVLFPLNFHTSFSPRIYKFNYSDWIQPSGDKTAPNSHQSQKVLWELITPDINQAAWDIQHFQETPKCSLKNCISSWNLQKIQNLNAWSYSPSQPEIDTDMVLPLSLVIFAEAPLQQTHSCLSPGKLAPRFGTSTTWIQLNSWKSMLKRKMFF